MVPEPIAHIAADPLEDAFDAADFAARLARKKTQVKRALLDQSLISGIGNIYADEALWRARLHWARPTETLRPAEVSRLLEAVRDVLTEALKAGGTSFDALYVNVNGESGYFDRSLNAYGREGEPCARCATPIRRDAFMNRSSYSCPRCQRPSAARQRAAAPASASRQGPPGERPGWPGGFAARRHVRSITFGGLLVGSDQLKAPRCGGFVRMIVCLTPVSLVRLAHNG